MHFCVKRHTTTIGFYDANVQSASDYYAFGQLLPGRNAGENYRYGFNGMEEDNETKGEGNSYTTEFRQYDPRIGRWPSLDPIAHLREWVSPYNYVQNNPILRIDPLGSLDDNYIIHEDGTVEVQKTDEKTDNFKYVNKDSQVTD
jgi:RHS repeat-associated protein